LTAAPVRDDGQDMARTTYTTQHPPVWGSMVSGYLVTKAIAAGVMLVAALLVLLGHGDDRTAVGVVPPVVAGAFLVLTGVLLVGDLKQPKRFVYLLTRGNRTSWLVKGAWVLAAFAACLAAWWIAGLVGAGGALAALAVPTVLLALGTAGYTAFLFGQCEGRDLWQEPLLLPVLVSQAVMAGGAVYSLFDLFLDVPSHGAVKWAFLVGLVANAGLVVAELTGGHSRHVTMALAELRRGGQRKRYREFAFCTAFSLVFLGLDVIFGEIVFDWSGPVQPLVPLAALYGLFAYEDAYVRAGQSVPLS